MRKNLLYFVGVVSALFTLSAGVALAQTTLQCQTDPCVGTEGADEIRGTDANETIRALGGDDHIYPYRGDDIIYAGDGRDARGEVLFFSEACSRDAGNDTWYGGGDQDLIQDRNGINKLYGGSGDDQIDLFDDLRCSLAETPDEGYGGRGNDLVTATDGQKDYIDCGKGRRDQAYFDDGIDAVAMNCEKKYPENL